MEIRFENLAQDYGNGEIFSGVSGTLQSGKPVCIMGASGSGKTSLLYILMGLREPSAGTVHRPENLRIGVVFQEDRLVMALSAVMNVALAQENADKNAIERELAALGIDAQQAYRPVSELSGGQRRRVAVLRALMAGNDALFFDEPFTGLDDAAREMLQKYIVDNLNGRILALITHAVGDADALGAQVLNL